MDNLNDSELILKYLEGDEQSLDFLVKRYIRQIYGFAYKYAHDDAKADDITQETFIKAWKNIKKFDTEKNFKAWLFSIAKNTALDLLKKKKALPFSEISAIGGSAFGGENRDGENALEQLLADSAPLPDEFLIKKDIKADIKKMIRRISKKYRGVLSLRYDADLTFREIAEILGEPLNTVKSRHRRAVAELKKNFC